MRRLIGCVLFLGLWPATVPSAATAKPACARVIAVGDLHGAYESFVALLRENDLIDEDNRWRGKDTCLVQLGDIVDRGVRSRELLDLILSLQRQAPQHVFPLIGNHEAMNVVGDLRYVTPEEFAAFAAEEPADERERGFAAFAASVGDASGSNGDGLRRLFDERFPPGWFAHRRAFSPTGEYGAWILDRPTLLRIGRTLFVHAGVSPEDATAGIAALNRRVTEDLRRYGSLRERLGAEGWISPLATFSESFVEVDSRLARIREGAEPPAEQPVLEAARAFLGLRSSPFVRPDGPLWIRELALEDPSAFEPRLDEVLRRLDVDRIVVGHTQPEDPRIGMRFERQLFSIDTGAGPAYEGRISALEIGGETIRALYLGGSEELAEVPLEDAAIERLLLEGRVVSMEEIGVGISRPMKLLLEFEGRQRKAAFKTIDVQKTGELTRFRKAPTQFNFSDRYQYERAAYLLDRLLGMRMVPVAVLREIDGRAGAVVDWISGAVNEKERREEGLKPTDPLRLMRQQEIMRIFDGLIRNTDRNLANQLITTADWRLHLIDHSRSFNLLKKLPEGFLDQPISLPRWLYERMRELDEQTLDNALEGLVSRAQIKALLQRRDRILKKVDADRTQFGDGMVFH